MLSPMVGRQHLASAADVVLRPLRDGASVEVGPIEDAEHAQLFVLFGEIVGGLEGYPHAPPLTRAVYDATFVDPVTLVAVARADGALLGGYYLKPNFPGRGAHIANAGYLVARPARGRGVGFALVEDSIARAPLVGFDAIQFNLVFASNPARRMYERLGFAEIGRVPRAIDGEDAVIYHRFVGGADA